jgi:hypothetical protein
MAGVVTSGWLDVDGKYSVVPGVPARRVFAEAT